MSIAEQLLNWSGLPGHAHPSHGVHGELVLQRPRGRLDSAGWHDQDPVRRADLAGRAPARDAGRMAGGTEAH